MSPMIELILGEGPNDKVFVKDVLLYIGMDNSKLYVFKNLRDHRENFRHFHKKLLQETRFLQDKISVFGDNGKSNLLNKMIPRIVTDFIVKGNLKAFILLDKNGHSYDAIINKVSQNIANTVNRMPKLNITLNKSDNNIINITSSSFYTYCQIFLIPKSLEKQIVEKAFESNRNFKKYQNIDPHDAMKYISEELGISKDELIQKAVREEWFKNTRWFKSLIKQLENFLNISSNKIDFRSS